MRYHLPWGDSPHRLLLFQRIRGSRWRIMMIWSGVVWRCLASLSSLLCSSSFTGRYNQLSKIVVKHNRSCLAILQCSNRISHQSASKYDAISVGVRLMVTSTLKLRAKSAQICYVTTLALKTNNVFLLEKDSSIKHRWRGMNVLVDGDSFCMVQSFIF